MLGAFGFTVTAVLFLIFALSLPKHIAKNDADTLKNFRIAYILLAVTFFGYGLAALNGGVDLLGKSMIFGNLLLLAATLLILDILFNGSKYNTLILYAAALGGMALIFTRIIYFYPHPYMQDSILVFNSERMVSFLLSAVFLLIWLPVNLRMGKLITSKAKLHPVRSAYIFLFYAATFSAVMFLLAKKPVTLVVSFTALSFAFLMLVVSNFLVKSVEEKAHGK